MSADKFVSALRAERGLPKKADTPLVKGRTSAGLRDMLFDCIEAVHKGEMTSGEAQSIAQLTKQILQTVETEIKVQKLRNDFPADTKLTLPQPLTLGERAKDG